MDLERQFIDFSNYVPYLDGNESVYSFRLMNLILAIGAHVDSAFKEMFRCPDFSVNYPKILKKVQDGEATITDYRKLEKSIYSPKEQLFLNGFPNAMCYFLFINLNFRSLLIGGQLTMK
jgi:hypothetical protein